MKLSPYQILSIAAVVGFGVIALTGCGSGSGGVDPGGMTGSLRASATTAFENLRYSAVFDTIATLNTPGTALSACTLHVVSSKPLVFRLYMEWKPKYLGYKRLPLGQTTNQTDRVRYSWLAAIIPTTGNAGTRVDFGQIPASVPIQAANRQLELRQGPAFVKPFEECQLLPTGTLRGFSYGDISTPLTTTTTPYATTTTR